MGSPKIKLFLPLAVALLVILACAIPTTPGGNNIPATQALLNTQPIPFATTQLPTGTAIIIPATITSTATSTSIPTLTFTPTLSIPMVTVSVGTNCRVGPGRVYDRVDGLLVGEQAEIVRLAPASVNYVVIKRPHEPGECWLWLEYATITGDTSRLPIAVIPPTPTPTLTFTPTMTSTPTSTPTSTATLTPPSAFGGAWNMVIFGNPYVVTLVQTGNSITGSFTPVGGSIVNLTGTLGADGKTVTGSFAETAGVSGTFIWHLLNNLVQFNGHGDITGNGSLEWCGYRAGQSAPVPCQAP
jgi:hypothetical protein